MSNRNLPDTEIRIRIDGRGIVAAGERLTVNSTAENSDVWDATERENNFDPTAIKPWEQPVPQWFATRNWAIVAGLILGVSTWAGIIVGLVKAFTK